MMSSPPTIFVADDDPVLLRGLGVALQGRGYAVRTAPSGAALLSLLEDERPDLLVLDVMMPGMSGLDVLRTIRGDRRWRDVPVVIVTALPHVGVWVEARMRGGAEVVPKPFRLGELVGRIEGWVGGGEELLGKPGEPEVCDDRGDCDA